MHTAMAGLRRWPVAVLAVLVLGVASVAALAAASGGSTISACAKKRGGAVRIVGAQSRCRHGERRLAWSATGPAGRQGPRGFTGAKGPTGATGSPGAGGAAGGFVDTNPGNGSYVTLSTSPSVVADLKLPAGRYLVQADVHVRDTAAATTPVTCTLEGNGETLDQSVIDVGPGAPQTEHGDIALGGGMTLTAAGMAFVACTPAAGGNSAAGAKIVATQVSTLTSTAG